jgi:hypothetical protein
MIDQATAEDHIDNLNEGTMLDYREFLPGNNR